MGEIIQFIAEHKNFTIVLLIANYMLVKLFEVQLTSMGDKRIKDAKAGRGEKKSIYGKYLELLKKSIDNYDRKEKKSGIYVEAKELLKKAGYKGEYAASIYLALRYIVPLAAFIIIFAVTYPDYWAAILLSLYISQMTKYIVIKKKKRIASKFKLAEYKVYKYLHNQISSGVGIPDAIKSVYEVVEDMDIKDGLIRFAAVYGRTNNIDMALTELKSNFDTEEVDTLCVAIKQGIESGDNRNILEKQEQVMFSRYFNYVQAETDACKNRSTLAVIFFVAIVVIMIAVPMFREATEALSKIFIN